jgi:hypothetical protein
VRRLLTALHAGLRKRIAAANAVNATHPTLAHPPTTSYTYGAHMAIGMGLGFLFMGAGALTFATTPQAGEYLVSGVGNAQLDHQLSSQAWPASSLWLWVVRGRWAASGSKFVKGAVMHCATAACRPSLCIILVYH